MFQKLLSSNIIFIILYTSTIIEIIKTTTHWGRYSQQNCIILLCTWFMNDDLLLNIYSTILILGRLFSSQVQVMEKLK